ncbi:hypothetical protein C8Q72DRAFT_776542, partial [Fomitopsis betulina]
MGNCLDYGDIPEIPLGHALASEVKTVLSKYIDIPGIDAEEWGERERFAATQYTDYVKLRDMYLAFVVLIPNAMLENAYLDLPNWYAQMLRRELRPESFDLDDLEGELESFFSSKVNKNASPEYLQRNSAEPRALNRVMPDPIVVVVDLNGQPVRALLDSGSLSDFVS